MSLPKKLKVTVIVLTFNSSKYLDGCFGTLEKMNTEGLEADILVVDNGSSDGTPAEIRRRWPLFEVVDTGSNLGFASGNNFGIRLAIERGANYVYLLNHDTEISPDFLIEAVRVAESDLQIGSVQSLLLLHPDRELVNSTGNAVHFLGFGYCQDYRRRLDRIDTETVREIPYASGAAVLCRLSALEQVGDFDERFFMYHEDLDLGWRLRLAGYKNVLAPKSVVWHKYEFSRSIGKWYYMERNRYLVLFKNLRLWTLIVLAPWLIMTEFGMAIPAALGGWWSKKVKALTYFLRPSVWSYIIKERERVAAWRKVSDREIFALFTPTIRDQEKASLFAMWVANPLLEVAWRIVRPFIR